MYMCRNNMSRSRNFYTSPDILTAWFYFTPKELVLWRYLVASNIKIYLGTHVMCTIVFSVFNQIWNFSTYSHKIPQYKILLKSS
jgi:hypothetical protein